jgi:hypothetical protein
MDDRQFIVRVVVVTLAAILVAVIGAMLYGLYDPRVDNESIFKIIGPAFQTVVGVFVGVLSSQALTKKD